MPSVPICTVAKQVQQPARSPHSSSKSSRSSSRQSQQTYTSAETWREYQLTRSLALRNQIASENDLLAKEIANRMLQSSAEAIDDLIQLARMGLIRAIERFDPSKQVAFSSFAVPYIAGEIQHFGRDHFGHLKIPRTAFEDFARVRKRCRELERKYGRKIEPALVAEQIGIDPEKWRWVEDAVQRRQLIDLEDQHHLPLDYDGEEDLDTERAHDRLKLAIANLPRLERDCVTDHWFKGLTAAKIARERKLQVGDVEEILEGSIALLRKQLGSATCLN